MDKDPFKKNQEQLEVRVEIASKKDAQAYKTIRIKSLKSEEGIMLGVTPEMLQKAENRTDEEWEKDLTSDSMFVVLAWKGSETIGIGMAIEREPQIWHMRAQYVEGGLRNEGTGKKLSAVRLKEIIKRGGIKVDLGVKADNATSIHIAESFGFEKVEEDSSPEGFYMELDLSDPVVSGNVLKKVKDILNAG
jgi:ribosomal protein S18 acetylase RimI-like enzyme